MANEFIARNGLIAQNNSTITGSLTVTQGITGSLQGTASYAVSGGNQNFQQVTNAGSSSTNTITLNPTASATGLNINTTFDQDVGNSTAIYLDLAEQSTGININASTNDSTALYVTGNANANAIQIINSGTGIYVNNPESGLVVTGTNLDTGILIINPNGEYGIIQYIGSGSANSINLGSTAKGIVINSGLSSTGNFIELNKNGVDKLIVNQEGAVTATSFTGSLQGTASLATTASYALNAGVTQIVAGTNVTISPTNGLGAVTINSTGGGGGTNLGLVQAMIVGLQNIF